MYRKVYAVDFDGTLAYWDGVWKGDPTNFGDPIYPMVDRVRQWLKEGIEVWIFTARLDPDRVPEEEQEIVRAAIADWTRIHIGTPLRATAIKKVVFHAFYDDRAFRVESNTGEIYEPEIDSGQDHSHSDRERQVVREFLEKEGRDGSLHDDVS